MDNLVICDDKCTYSEIVTKSDMVRRIMLKEIFNITNVFIREFLGRNVVFGWTKSVSFLWYFFSFLRCKQEKTEFGRRKKNMKEMSVV